MGRLRPRIRDCGQVRPTSPQGDGFIPEALIAEQVENGWCVEPGEEEDALAKLRSVFAAHDAAPR